MPCGASAMCCGTSQLDYELAPENVHIGPSDYEDQVARFLRHMR